MWVVWNIHIPISAIVKSEVSPWACIHSCHFQIALSNTLRRNITSSVPPQSSLSPLLGHWSLELLILSKDGLYGDHIWPFILKILWQEFALSPVQSFFYNIRRYCASCQKREAINCPTQLWHQWTITMACKARYLWRYNSWHILVVTNRCLIKFKAHSGVTSYQANYQGWVRPWFLKGNLLYNHFIRPT